MLTYTSDNMFNRVQCHIKQHTNLLVLHHNEWAHCLQMFTTENLDDVCAICIEDTCNCWIIQIKIFWFEVLFWKKHKWISNIF